MAYAYNNLGFLNQSVKQYDTALYYFVESTKLRVKYDRDKDKIMQSYCGIANVYTDLKMYDLSIKNLHLAEKYLDTINYSGFSPKLLVALASSYNKVKQYRMAIKYLDKYSELLNKKVEEFEKFGVGRMEKAFADSIANENQKQIQELEIANQNAQIEKDKQQKVFLGIGLIFVLIGGIMFYNRYKITKEQNGIIEAQKHLVVERNQEITFQRDMLEEKQKEIIDSINYAHRIQNAVMAGESVWKDISTEYFIVFKPKDIVSGDFYWAYNTPEKSIWAAADCTGHGVPGAFMSMLGNSFLNQIVIENKITNPADILNSLRLKIIEALEKEGVSHNDGMDISLCVWNKLTKLLEFAAANNSAVIARKGELMELKADKMPIGKYHGELVSFTKAELVLEENDTVYIYTDGYADQFGGPKGKKFRYKTLDEMLLKNAQLSMNEQKNILDETFLTWKGGLIQTDDVCVIAVKVVT